jgi:outer membrane protein TolC
MTRQGVALACATCAFIWFAGAARADDAEPETERWTLDRLIAAALKGPQSRAAEAATDEARGNQTEVHGMHFPSVSVTGLLAPSPEIRCLDASCSTTSPQDATVAFDGVFGRIQVSLVQPLFTFGKLSAASDASEQGVKMAESQEQSVTADVALDVAKAYYGLKLARETRWMLEEGAEMVVEALANVNTNIAAGDPEVTLQDRYRLETLEAEIEIRLSDAREAEGVALAGLRALSGEPLVDVDEAPLEAVEFEVGAAEAYAGRARDRQPEVKLASAGTEAAEDLARVESARYLPDLLLVGSVTYAGATDADNPPSAFADDPYNTASAAIALALRWTIDPMAHRGRVARAHARSRRARALLGAVRDRADFQARRAHLQVTRAHEQLATARKGERSARAWVASVLQSEAVGTVSAKDLADAYLAYFTARARSLGTIHAWNVSVFSLRRATGELTDTTAVQPASSKTPESETK